MKKILEVVSPGLLTTIQDLGRVGYQKYGLPVSGAADHYAYRMANIILCNDENEACLEITLMGLKLRVLKPSIICITGGNLNPQINNKSITMWKAVKVNEGDLISFTRCISGCRSYVAIAGGIDVAPELGSRSTDMLGKIGGINGRALQKGDIIHSGVSRVSEQKILRRRISPNLTPNYPKELEVRVVLGPQDESFTTEGIHTFLSSQYKISIDSDRIACRLEGPEIKHKTGPDILSEVNFFGAVQVPENGLPILFQVGRPSIGGYTKIAGVISVDLPKVAQLKPGDFIRFKEIQLTEAHHLFRKQEKIFNVLKHSY